MTLGRPRTRPDTEINERRRARDRARYYRPDPLLGWAKTSLMNCKARARLRDFECTLTLDDVYQAAKRTTHCAITKVPLWYGRGRKKPYEDSASVDRIDNTGNYTPGGIAIISRRANAVKNNLSIDEMIALGQYGMLLKQ